MKCLSEKKLNFIFAVIIFGILISPVKSARAEDAVDLSDEDALGSSTSKEVSVRTAHVQANPVFAMSLLTTKITFEKLQNAHDANSIAAEVGNLCDPHFARLTRKVEDTDWFSCKETLLKLGIARFSEVSKAYRINRSTSDSYLSGVAAQVSGVPQAKSLNIPSSAEEASLRPIIPRVSTFTELSHEYENKIASPDRIQAAMEANHAFLVKYKTTGVDHEGYVKMKSMPNLVGGGEYQVVQMNGGKIEYDERAYAAAIKDKGAKFTLNPNDTNLIGDAMRNPPPKGARGSVTQGNVISPTFVQSFSYGGSATIAPGNTMDNNRDTYNQARHLINKTIAEGLTKFGLKLTGGGSPVNRSVAVASGRALQSKAPIAKAQAIAATIDPSKSTVSSRQFEDEKIELPPDAGRTLSQFSINYSESTLKSQLQEMEQERISDTK